MRTLALLGDRYRLGPIIGTGGMGAVHRAYDERFGREVAVKVVRAGADAVEQERLRREAQYLAGLDHPNLVAVYDAGADHLRSGETVWFAMELVHGPDLRAVIRDRGRLSPAAVARVLGGCSGALQVLHAAGVLHRDLKPANVLLTTEPDHGSWEVKIADLGIAQLMKADHLTATGQVVGTAAYLSPEQVSGGRIGPASDVYALGLLAIEALTGRVPFPGGPAESATARLVRSPDVPAGAGEEWASLLAEMTARDPADRPTASEVEHRLQLLPLSAEPISDPEATAVLPASVLRPERAIEEVPTEAMAVVDTRVLRVAAPTSVLPGPAPTDWAPSLRTRRPLRRRRRVLAAGAVAVAIGLAGGGAAIIGGTSAPDKVAAATVSSAPSKAAVTPKTTRTPATRTPTPAATASVPAKAVSAQRTAPPSTDSDRQRGRGRGKTARQQAAEAMRQAVEGRARGRLQQLQQRLEQDLWHGFRLRG